MAPKMTLDQLRAQYAEEETERYAQSELDQDRNPTAQGLIEHLAGRVRGLETRTTWEAGPEVDALLAQLRGDPAAVVEALDQMDVHRLAQLGQHLYAMQGVLAEVATAKARGLRT